MSQSSSEIGQDPSNTNLRIQKGYLPKQSGLDTSRSTVHGPNNQFQALNNLLGKQSDKTTKSSSSLLATSIHGTAKSLTPKMEPADPKLFRPNPERVDKYLNEMKIPNSSRGRGVNTNLQKLMPLMQMRYPNPLVQNQWPSWTQPLNANQTPCIGQGNTTQNLLMQQMLMAKLNQQALINGASNFTEFKAPQPVQKNLVDLGNKKFQGTSFQINGGDQNLLMHDKRSPNFLNLVKNMGLQSQMNMHAPRNVDKSPALSNISVDGSNHGQRNSFDLDLKQGARDRSMSSNTMNQSMSSGRSRGQSCYSSGSIYGSSLSTEERRSRVLKYWEKKKARMNRNHVRYSCRKDLAENRFRYHGRFISKEQMEKILDNQGGLDEIYNPKTKCTPKTKQIFKVEKFQRSTSSCSNQCPSRKCHSDEDMQVDREVPYNNMGLYPQEQNEIGNGFSDNYNHCRLFGAQTNQMSLYAQKDLIINSEGAISNIGPLPQNIMQPLETNLNIQNNQQAPSNEHIDHYNIEFDHGNF